MPGAGGAEGAETGGFWIGYALTSDDKQFLFRLAQFSANSRPMAAIGANQKRYRDGKKNARSCERA
jgi:hypothetical protein